MGKGNVADQLLQQLDNEGVDNVTEPSDLGTEEETLDMPEAKEDTLGKKAELVCKDDIKRVMDYDKIGLQKYAHDRLGKELDLGKRIKMLKTEVVLLIQKKLDLPTDVDTSNVTSKDAPENKEAEFVFNPVNRRIFEATELLLKRTDLIPCHVVDEEGKRI
jgi:hypothetical protein